MKTMHFSITDLETGTILKSHSVNKEEEISFKNGPINKEVGKQDGGIKEKEITTTKYFLQMLYNRPVGIAVYETKESLELQIGGYSDFEIRRV